MPAPKDYDTTIARIAGNVAHAFMARPLFDQRVEAYGLAAALEGVAANAVDLARRIVAEVKRTERA